MDDGTVRSVSRWRAFIGAHRKALVVTATALGGLAIFVIVWFQPHKLFIDERIDEGIPVALSDPTQDPVVASPTESSPDPERDRKAAPKQEAAKEGVEAGASPEPSPTPTEVEPDPPETEPKITARGKFRSLEHKTTGTALIIELADGRRFLRFEDLDTSNGPDLRIYLSEIEAGDDWYAYGERYVDLGALKGNIGDQNYLIPEGLDLSKYKSAVVWCRRFTVGFGVAPLDMP